MNNTFRNKLDNVPWLWNRWLNVLDFGSKKNMWCAYCLDLLSWFLLISQFRRITILVVCLILYGYKLFKIRALFFFSLFRFFFFGFAEGFLIRTQLLQSPQTIHHCLCIKMYLTSSHLCLSHTLAWEQVWESQESWGTTSNQDDPSVSQKFIGHGRRKVRNASDNSGEIA